MFKSRLATVLAAMVVGLGQPAAIPQNQTVVRPTKLKGEKGQKRAISGKPTGIAKSKREAAKRRNIRARSKK